VYTVRLTEEFQAWLDDLADRRAQVRIAARLRLYFARRGGVLIIMLAGGDKGSQARDIKRAQRIATELKEDP
jgi:putative component of toxin-antitoxin plasmid stabilization module